MCFFLWKFKDFCKENSVFHFRYCGLRQGDFSLFPASFEDIAFFGRVFSSFSLPLFELLHFPAGFFSSFSLPLLGILHFPAGFFSSFFLPLLEILHFPAGYFFSFSLPLFELLHFPAGLSPLSPLFPLFSKEHFTGSSRCLPEKERKRKTHMTTKKRSNICVLLNDYG